MCRSRYTHVVWDFNGTVLDDMQAGIDSVNEMLAARGLPTLNGLTMLQEIFCFPVREYYRRLGFDFERESYDDVLAPSWVEGYLARRNQVRIFPQVFTVSRALRQAGFRQSVLSASEKKMLEQQLAERNGTGLFDEIWGTDSIYAHGKLELARLWRAAHPDARAVMLGDTTHDAETAACLGADCILIAAGYHSRQRLLTCGVPVVDTLEECLPYILAE